MTKHSIAFLTLVAIALGGCTSTADLKAPVDAFAAAANADQKTLQTYDQVLDAAALEKEVAVALDNGTILPRDGDCIRPPSNGGKVRCRLVAYDADKVEHPLDSLPAPDPVARQIMAGIVTYANNLQAIAALDTEAGVKEATSGTLTSIQQLAGDVDQATAAGLVPGIGPTALVSQIGKYAGPVSDLFNFAAGKYLEEKKIEALRSATTAMNPILDDLVKVCAASAHAGAKIKEDQLYDDYSSALSAWNKSIEDRQAAKAKHRAAAKTPPAQKDSDARARLDALVKAASAYDTFLSLDQQSAFHQLVTAHAKLKTALESPKPNFASAWKAAQQAIGDAQRVQAIIAEFQKAAAAK